jgi:hypothetical protein
MSDLFDKLNIGSHAVIYVLNAPPGFSLHTVRLRDVKIRSSIGAKDIPGFVIAFATKQTQLERVSLVLSKCGPGDAVVWVAYPKASSKRMTCDFNRDTGWAALGRAGYEPVRQVAVDEDWSALRFRRVEYIKKLTRKKTMLISAKAKRRVSTR